MSICLNMIVKNESHIIEETLTNLLKKIKFDYWVICDTGSTDTTKELIQKFFDSRGISGELIDSEWKNFSHNRTVAFQNAYKKTDYVFVWDADDEIEGDFKLPEHLTADWYNFTFANDFGVNYSRPQLFKNTLRWKYISVLHEYAVCEEHAEPAIHVQGNYHFISGRRGARSKDPNKYLNDALLLEKAYYEALETKDSLYNRYAFYCAGSYRDCGNKEKALEFYKKVLTHDNWSEEKYVSCRNIYELYRDLGKEVEGLGYLVKSREYSARRVECVYQLILHYCFKGQNDVAYMYYTLIQNYYENEYMPSHMNGFLFANKKEFELLLPYYMIIVAQRTRHYETGMKMCELICRFQYPDVNAFYAGNWIYNMQFFMDHLPKDPQFFKNFREYLKMIKSTGISVQNVQNVIDNVLKKDPQAADVRKYKIPKNIFQTFESNNFSKKFQSIIDSWKEKNLDYTYHFYNSNDREDFIQTYFDENVYNAYCRIIPGAYKADLWRYCILYIYGGIYVDIDTLCIGQINDFLTADIDFMAPIDLNSSAMEGTHNIANGFIASVPKHEILMNCIKRIVHNVENNIIPQSKLDFSGPGLLGRAINTYLNLSEEESVIGKEGIVQNIHFLKFERTTEFIKNEQGNILFQNKNGNNEIGQLYNAEINKHNIISWLTCRNVLHPIDYTIAQRRINKVCHNNVKAVIMYGGFRSFRLNLKRNMEELLSEISSPIHFYILTEYCEDYEEKKQEVIDIIKSYNHEIKYFENINTCSHYNKEEEEAIYNNYYSIFFKGDRNDFTPKLFYRRCLINKIMNTFKIDYDKIICARLFDIVIKRYKSLDFINDPTDDTLYYSIDTIIIGKMNALNKMFAINSISNILHIPEYDLNNFIDLYKQNDRCLASLLPLCSETIYHSIIFKKFLKNSKNLRFDYTRQNIQCQWQHTKNAEQIIEIVSKYVTDDYLFVFLCPNRL